VARLAWRGTLEPDTVPPEGVQRTSASPQLVAVAVRCAGGGSGVAVVRIVVVVTAGNVVVEAPGGVTVRVKVPCAPPYPSTTMKYVCPAVTVGVMREARFMPLALAQASSLHATAVPLAQDPPRI